VTLHAVHATQLVDPDQRGDATWVGIRDGEEGCPWQPVTSDGAGTYTMPVTHDVYAVAIACADPAFDPSFRIIDRTVAEETELRAICPVKIADTSAAHHVGVELVGEGMFQWFLLNLNNVPQLIGNGLTTTLSYYASSGRYDIAVLGHAANDPDRLLLGRDLDGRVDQIVQADPAAAGWSTFGPAVTLAENPASDTQTSVFYITNNGTWVPIAQGLTPPLQVPTWPAAWGAAGDVYLAEARGLSNDHQRDWDAESFATDPSGFMFVTPPMFDASVDIVAREPPLWQFTTLTGAAEYGLSCAFDGFSVEFDSSAGAVAAQGLDGYLMSSFPDDPSSPPWPELAGCPLWTGIAAGSAGGLATEDTIGQIGRVAGTPAKLAGTERWVARVQIQPTF
jgi:hypothetical protein